MQTLDVTIPSVPGVLVDYGCCWGSGCSLPGINPLLSGSIQCAQPRGKKRVQDTGKLARFDQAVVPHLDAAYNLARWLMRNEQDAEDMVQEACLRALTFFHSFQGEDGRAWLLAIVRNTCYTWLKKNRAQELDTAFEEEIHSVKANTANPEVVLLQKADRELLQQLLEQLPTEFREVVILRELEGMSYKQISAIADVPIGTVMSRLARARKRLEQQLAIRTRMES